jgi:hypothetical protein
VRLAGELSRQGGDAGKELIEPNASDRSTGSSALDPKSDRDRSPGSSSTRDPKSDIDWSSGSSYAYPNSDKVICFDFWAAAFARLFRRCWWAFACFALVSALFFLLSRASRSNSSNSLIGKLPIRQN